MRKAEFKAGYHYHLYNRGVNRQPVFFNDENWSYFLRLVRRYFTPDRIDVVAYCLLPNHYHLLVSLRTDDLGKEIMQPFTVAYTKAINKQQGRTGPLFEGAFQARLVDREEYLLHLSRYIHLNPVLAGLVARPADWAFSSYRDYVGLRRGTLPAPGIVLGQFPSPQAYAAFVEAYRPEDRKFIEELIVD